MTLVSLRLHRPYSDECLSLQTRASSSRELAETFPDGRKQGAESTSGLATKRLNGCEFALGVNGAFTPTSDRDWTTATR
jgi:hypothetical protein